MPAEQELAASEAMSFLSPVACQAVGAGLKELTLTDNVAEQLEFAVVAGDCKKHGHTIRLAVDMDIHGYIHGYIHGCIHVWISDLDRAVDISMDINARSLTFFLL